MTKRQSTSFFSKSLPFLSTLFLLLLSYTPFSFGLPTYIKPLFALIAVFFWLTHRPDIFNMFSVVAIGIIADCISSSPSGSNLLMYFIIYALTTKFERFFYSKPFVVYWYGFGIFAFVTILLKWTIVSMYYSQFLPLGSTFFTYLTTIIFYPFISMLCTFIQGYVSYNDE